MINGARRKAQGTRFRKCGTRIEFPVFFAVDRILKKEFVLNAELQALSLEPCLPSEALKAKEEAVSLFVESNDRQKM